MGVIPWAGSAGLCKKENQAQAFEQPSKQIYLHGFCFKLLLDGVPAPTTPMMEYIL